MTIAATTLAEGESAEVTVESGHSLFVSSSGKVRVFQGSHDSDLITAGPSKRYDGPRTLRIVAESGETLFHEKTHLGPVFAVETSPGDITLVTELGRIVGRYSDGAAAHLISND